MLIRNAWNACIVMVLTCSAFVGVLTAAPREALAGVDDGWKYYRSPNFEMYSRQGERESREMLRKLEVLRAVFIERFKWIERARLDITMYYFRTVADFQAYRPGYLKNDSFRGFYLAGPDRAVIALAPTDRDDGPQRLVYHEYVHHLFRAGEEDPPAWYNEGMAEVLGSIREQGNQVEIGQPQVWRLLALRGEQLMPLEQLFAVDESSSIYRSRDHTGLFYAQSWALLHYWLFGKSQLPDGAVTRFLKVAANQRAAAKIDLRAYFNECFGMDYPEMQRRLQRYVSTGSYGYSRQPTPKVDSPESFEVRSVPRDEIRARLADLSLRMTESPLAKLLLLEAAEKNSADPRPFEVLGAHALRERDESEARRRWEQAMEAGSDNVAIHRELAVMESRDWFSRFDYYFRLPAEATGRLRTRLSRSIERDPQQTVGYEMLAWVEAFSDDPNIANVNLVQKQFERLKHPDRTLVALALVRVRVGKPDEALAILDQLSKLEVEPWSEHAAEVVRAKIEGRPVRPPAPRAQTLPGGPRPVIRAPALDVPGRR